MTTRDPDLQREIDRAVRELVRRLRPVVVGLQDLDDFARRFVEDLRAEGWRPPLRPGPDWRSLRDRPPADPASNEAIKELRDEKGWTRR